MKDLKHIKRFNESEENLNSGTLDKSSSISDVSESRWNMIPDRCEYNGKIYRILNIDLQGGYFKIQDLEAERGVVQVLDDIDIDKCIPIYSH